MTKRTELHRLIKDVVYNAEQSLISAQNQNKYMYDYYAAKVASIDDELEYLLGNRETEFDHRVELKTTLYGCSDAKIDDYMENSDFSAAQRCLGIIERASLETANEMY